jgi:hypothetical protein
MLFVYVWVLMGGIRYVLWWVGFDVRCIGSISLKADRVRALMIRLGCTTLSQFIAIIEDRISLD